MIIAIALLGAIAFDGQAQRQEQKLTEGWEFKRGGVGSNAEWSNVVVPHDWAIYGPFSRDYDLQLVAVEQNGEKEETWKTGRTGGLPFIGKGAYRKSIEIPDTAMSSYTLVFDGAMSNAKVSVNGKHAISWPYGYNSFYVNIDSLIHLGQNELLVELENYDKQSRWYPGAGLYRNVHLLQTSKIKIPVWGVYVTTPYVKDGYATVNVVTEVDGLKKGENIDVTTLILDSNGVEVCSSSTKYVTHGQPLAQNLTVQDPMLWSPDSPALYNAVTKISIDGKVIDVENTRFGIRTLEYIPEKGFFLNGEYTKFKGVCNHHDLGPLGAAVNKSAIRHQVALLKEMGANAIRTAHNMPAPELVEVCDEMGMMLMIEPFDDWGFRPKSPNGYGKVFDEWAERDITNMVKQYRSKPSVVMWSIGNEVPSQWGPNGIAELMMLQDLVHELDPTRPVTCGMDQIDAVLNNGFAAALDIPGFNYKPQHYRRAYNMLPQKLILGSETASTVASRGMYMRSVSPRADALHHNHQSSAYGNEYCSWSNVPDLDFAADDDFPWMIGQFVWTGFDYLGEPSPYDTDAWPNHSSMFGIIDLASLPKDTYYLYRSQWRADSPTLHVLPHWTWHGHEGYTIPVMVFTSYPSAELFVNGVSLGVKSKDASVNASQVPQGYKEYADYTPQHRAANAASLMNRYRLCWENVAYSPGNIKVVAYDKDGNIADERIVKTAGKPHHIVLTSNLSEMKANGEDLAYITVQIADKDGNIIPDNSQLIDFAVEGSGKFEATANGDPTCLMPFQVPRMKLFSGAATAIVRSGYTPGLLNIKASAKGVKQATLTIHVKN